MADRKGFRFQNDNVYWFFTLDRPIHRDQVSRFDQEFDAAIDEILLKPASKDVLRARVTKKWRAHLNSITHDGYGSFRLDFDSEIGDYTDAELEAFNEDIFEIVAYLPIVETIRNWIGIEEDLEDFIECHGAEDAMEMYIDAVLDSGYRLCQRDVEEMFMPHITAQAIANDFLFRKLKGQDVACKEVKQAKESLADCFELETTHAN
jgi:hypothetical protein